MGWLTSVFSAISSLKVIITSAISIWKWLSDFWTKRSQKKVIDEAKEAEQKLRDANSIQDDEERMKRKVEAACELEKAINPDARCDS